MLDARTDGPFVNSRLGSTGLWDDLNTLRLYTPTADVYAVHDTLDERGALVRESIPWTLRDDTPAAAAHMAHIAAIAAARGVTVLTARMVMVQLRIKRARGFTHFLTSDSSGAFTWFSLDDPVLLRRMLRYQPHKHATMVARYGAPAFVPQIALVPV